MIYNTRFNPTANGYLHLGHIFCALVNQAEAHRSGGKFIVRFDDTQRVWNWTCGSMNVCKFKWGMRNDLEWLGIEPDVWSSQSELMPKVESLAATVGYQLAQDTFSDWEPITVVGDATRYYPADERLTVEHVFMDQIEGVNLLIRGVDLLTENNAYKIFCKRFGFSRVQHVYIHKLDFDGDTISKTTGNYKIKDFRKAGMDPLELENNLATDCLINKFDGNRDEVWRIDNVKPNPILGEWAREALYAVQS